MKLKIVASTKLLVDCDVESVSLPSLEGELGIYPGHIPMFIGLDKGNVTYRAEGSEESVFVAGGYAQVMPDRVIIMTEGSDEGGPRPS
jgi:F0F1-type ATP synthase, epsilon subunit (mitochondrial delta subunit)